ncbi:MAG TPA: nucleoside kinase [Candidatus Acetothermia bacterium]|nr:MAG: nucleoside kinase [Candidatus Acetothermia bacterium]HDC92995.1 nucleoside kinase [Candidatus Acetothermia bacterium]
MPFQIPGGKADVSGHPFSWNREPFGVQWKIPMAKVYPSRPRSTAQVRLSDGRIFEGPVGTKLEDFLRAAFPDAPIPFIAGITEGKLLELSTPVERDLEIRPVFITDSEGIRIYTRSLVLLLAAAVEELFPGTRIVVDHSVPFGGYYCWVLDREPFGLEELSLIESKMREFVEADAPIEKRMLPAADAARALAAQGKEAKAELLLSSSHEARIPLYRLGKVQDYFFGPMAPSAGYLRFFALSPYHRGFILRFPRRERPTELSPVEDYTALWQVFEEYGRWLELLGLQDVRSINKAIGNGRIREIILVSEALHQERIVRIAEEIAELPPERRRIVLIAGPSASGKTTFTKRLCVQLISRGLRPYPISLDDYFFPREEMERRGIDDFDDVKAVDLELFRRHVEALLEGEEVRLPRFNFVTGKRERGPKLSLGRDGILLVEGIHCLNPVVLPGEPGENAFKIYVSALTQLNLDELNRIPTTDTRLIRRIVRDAAFRGYSAEDTLRLWGNVRRGEKRFIFPYQGRADVMFNSALAYEWAVLRPRAERLLLEVRDPKHRIEAERLLGLLRWVVPYFGREVPQISILREFIGGSILRDYFPSPFERALRR